MSGTGNAPIAIMKRGTRVSDPYAPDGLRVVWSMVGVFNFLDPKECRQVAKWFENAAKVMEAKPLPPLTFGLSDEHKIDDDDYDSDENE